MNLNEQNVLFIARGTQYGGTEKIILEMCEALVPYVKKIVVCSNGGMDVPYLDSLKIKHYEIPDIENKSPKVISSVIGKLSKIIKNNNINVVHSNHRMAAFYAQILSLQYEFIKVTTAHGVFENHKLLTMFCYENTDIIACGSTVAENLRKDYHIKECRITVIHNAVKIEQNEYSPIINNKKNTILVGNIGRLSEEKGQIYFIRAIPEVLKKNRNCMFVIIGDGDDRCKLEQETEKLGISENVRFLGHREDIANIISQLDIVVLSSLTEGLPLTPIEAFAQGIPVIATKVGGTAEIVHDGENGFLVPPKNVTQLSNKINKLIKEKEVYSILSNNAKETYEKEYSFEVFKNRVVSFYNNLNFLYKDQLKKINS